MSSRGKPPPATSGAPSPTSAVLGSGSSGASGSGFIYRSDTSAREIDAINRRVTSLEDKLDTKMSALETRVDAQVTSVLSEFKAAEAQRTSDFAVLSSNLTSLETKIAANLTSEVAAVTSALKDAERDRTIAQNELATSLNNVRSDLPTKDTIRNWALGGAAIILAVLALVWQVFGIGGDMAGNFADKVLDQKEQQQQIIDRLDKLSDKNQSQGSAGAGQATPVPAQS